MTTEELIYYLSTKGRTQPVTITVATIPAMRRRGNPYNGRLIKRSRVNGFINADYDRCMERAGVDHEPRPRKWGVHVDGTPLIEHNGKYYLQIKVERSLGHEYIDIDGRVVPDEAIKEWMPPRPSEPVILRTYAIDSIESITIDGNVLVVDGIPQSAQLVA